MIEASRRMPYSGNAFGSAQRSVLTASTSLIELSGKSPTPCLSVFYPRG